MTESPHSFHIPVMGISFTIDTPVKVARFGISSVVSITEDNILESMREYYSRLYNYIYKPVHENEEDYRAQRITLYLNLLNQIVKDQIDSLKKEAFVKGNDIMKYFELLSNRNPLKTLFDKMIDLPHCEEKEKIQNNLRTMIIAGSIDVNIMTKVDKTNYDKEGNALPAIYSDAMSALRGFAQSNLQSSIVFSAGLNPRLYSYCETFNEFYPVDNTLQKKIILKVSDFRSASIQGKFLAKKGLWVSEFRIESGLNCGGHAFATEGVLMGPILHEFQLNKNSLAAEMLQLCNNALKAKGLQTFSESPELKITAQGGIGSSNEHNFLLEHYDIDSAGWGSPFLLVPEATNVDEETLSKLAIAKREDYYLSHASPLGVPFNNFRPSSSEIQRKERIKKDRPGSPCYKKFLSSDTEFTDQPICTASRQYQDLKIKQIKAKQLPKSEEEIQINSVTEKDCLCEGLTASVYLKNDIPLPRKLKAVTICPGPNLAFFSGTFSLRQIVDHIYGRSNILNTAGRPNMFINELNMYVDYLLNEIKKYSGENDDKQSKYLNTFKTNLLKGIEYYRQILPGMKRESESYKLKFIEALNNTEQKILKLLNYQLVEI